MQPHEKPHSKPLPGAGTGNEKSAESVEARKAREIGSDLRALELDIYATERTVFETLCRSEDGPNLDEETVVDGLQAELDGLASLKDRVGQLRAAAATRYGEVSEG